MPWSHSTMNMLANPRILQVKFTFKVQCPPRSFMFTINMGVASRILNLLGQRIVLTNCWWIGLIGKGLLILSSGAYLKVARGIS